MATLPAVIFDYGGVLRGDGRGGFDAEFLTCGVFEGGVAGFQCEGCAREHLVPFSCKGRGWCGGPEPIRRPVNASAWASSRRA